MQFCNGTAGPLPSKRTNRALGDDGPIEAAKRFDQLQRIVIATPAEFATPATERRREGR